MRIPLVRLADLWHVFASLPTPAYTLIPMHIARLIPLAFGALFGCGNDESESGVAASCNSPSPACETKDATRCSDDGSSIILCRLDSAGCLVWTTVTPCGPHGACQLDTCVCHDDCALINERQCDGDTIAVCRADAAGCLFWEHHTRCAESGKTCGVEASQVACIGGCDTDGATRCNVDVVEVCSQNAEGHLAWLPSIDCATNDQHCSSASGTALCEDGS